MQKNIGSGFNYYCNTFVPCDKTKETVTLGDIAVDSDVFIGTTIDFLNSDGTNHYFEDGADKGKVESYIYIPEEYTDTGVAGWYQCEDSSGAGTCYNDRVIKLGESYCVSCVDGEEGATMTYSGAVAADSTTFNVGVGFNYLGNCAPAQITLGDIAVDGDVFIGSTIDFLNNDGTNHYFEDGTDKGKVESYIYIPEEYTDTGVAGWYQCEDSSGAGTCYNSRVIAAGDAFCVSCVDGEEGAAFTLPSAL